jgi:hypothetical protein
VTFRVTVLNFALPFLGVTVTVTLHDPTFKPLSFVPTTLQYFAEVRATFNDTFEVERTLSLANAAIDFTDADLDVVTVGLITVGAVTVGEVTVGAVTVGEVTAGEVIVVVVELERSMATKVPRDCIVPRCRYLSLSNPKHFVSSMQSVSKLPKLLDAKVAKTSVFENFESLKCSANPFCVDPFCKSPETMQDKDPVQTTSETRKADPAVGEVGPALSSTSL